MPPNPLRFARLPEAVLFDPTLGLYDIRVYATLVMHARSGNIVTLGQRRLSELAGIERRNVRRSLTALAKQGHISSAITKSQRRTIYLISSPVFSTHVRDLSGAPESPIVGAPESPRIEYKSKVVAFSRPARPAGRL